MEAVYYCIGAIMVWAIVVSGGLALGWFLIAPLFRWIRNHDFWHFYVMRRTVETETMRQAYAIMQVTGSARIYMLMFRRRNIRRANKPKTK